MQEYLEQIPHWLQSVTFFLFSTLKSYSGPSLSAIFDYSYSEMLLINFSAVIVSVLVSYNFRNQILDLFKKKSKNENGYNKRLKKSIILWNKYGFIGTAIISPVLISIPIGVIISAHFKTSKTKIFTYIIVSAFIWTNIFYFITKFGIKVF